MRKSGYLMQQRLFTFFQSIANSKIGKVSTFYRFLFINLGMTFV